ncbi:MAG: PD-(D/E)XK nuclease family protein [Chloroflexi bacterium]|nr:PD-(D/E)XK nuclease family protein [Chloroflexota bacterium]
MNNLLPTPFTFSQSSIQDFDDCPRRFHLRYIERLDYPAVESEPALENERRQQQGQAFHRLAQQYLGGIPAGRLAPLANSADLKRWWENFLALDLSHLTERWAELTLSAPLDDSRLLAKFDLVGRTAEGRFEIYDWKTYQRRPRNDRLTARWQTRLYRSLLLRAGSSLNGGQPIPAENVAMVYWFAEFPGEPARLAATSAQATRDWDALEKMVEEIRARREFPPTDDTARCSYCAYRSYCDRGVQAGQGEPDTDDPEPIEIDLEQIQEIEF